MLWLDATYLKVRLAGEIAARRGPLGSAVAANTEGPRMGDHRAWCIGPSEAEPFWTRVPAILEAVAWTGSGSSQRLPTQASRPPFARIFEALWPALCRVSLWSGTPIAHVRAVSYTVGRRRGIRQAFDQHRPPPLPAKPWRQVVSASSSAATGPSWHDLMCTTSEHDVLGLTCPSPAQHRTKLHSTRTVDRLNKEVKRRADRFVGIFSERGLPSPAPDRCRALRAG